MTLQDLISKAEAAKRQYVIYGAASNLITCRPEWHIEIGIQSKQKTSYCWFSGFITMTEDIELFFDHIYSQNTGKTKRGYKDKWSFLDGLK